MTDSKDAHSTAVEHLNNMVCQHAIQPKITVRTDRLTDKNSKVVLGEFLPDDVLPFITNDDTKREYVIDGIKHEVRMNSHRYFIFKASPCCAACGVVGTKMLLEQHPNDKSPHFNLYAVEDGELVLMTKDHIRAKSFGGEDRHSNYQTMCAICNNLKGNDNLTLADINRLRQLFNDHKKRLTKKKLNELINKERQFLRTRDWGRISKRSGLVAKTDLAIVAHNDGFQAVSIYEASEKATAVLACVKKGTELHPVRSDDKQHWIEFDDTTFAVYHGHTEQT